MTTADPTPEPITPPYLYDQHHPDCTEDGYR